jgi:hypothetical protein
MEPGDQHQFLPNRENLVIQLLDSDARNPLLHTSIMQVDYMAALPMLKFRFEAQELDFVQVLNYYDLRASDEGWLTKRRIEVLVEPTTANLPFKTFLLTETESDLIREAIDSQKLMSEQKVETIEDHIYATLAQILS